MVLPCYWGNMVSNHGTAEPTEQQQTAAQKIEERHPYAEVATYESSGGIDVTVLMDSARDDDLGIVQVSNIDAPAGYGIENVSLHAETDSVMVTFEPEGDR